MHVWPALVNLPQAILRAASSTSAVSSTTAGLLPPSSSVTGARCPAAACITFFPIAGLPVKWMWSKGRRVSASATFGPPEKSATWSSSKRDSTISAISAVVWGVNSEGLRIARLPAARVETSGISVRLTG